jgi:outer membrane lipoprotein-sorting protein
LIKASRFRKVIISSLLILTAQGCALLYKVPPQPPLPPAKLNLALSQIQEQEEEVRSFFWDGRLTLKDGYWEQESNILAAVTKEPRRIKIEITGTWGRPVAHLLFDGNTLTVVSFAERKVYVGEVTSETMSRVFPGHLDPVMIWDVLRAYPSLRPYHHPVSRKADEVSLVDEKGREVQILDLDPQNLEPRLVSFPGLQTRLAFADFRQDEGIIYAQEVKLIQEELSLTIHHEKMAFNKPIPETIFTLEAPPGFETADVNTLKQRKPLF